MRALGIELTVGPSPVDALDQRPLTVIVEAGEDAEHRTTTRRAKLAIVDPKVFEAVNTIREYIESI